MHSLIRNFILGISLFLVPSVASAQERVVDDNGPMSVGGNVNFMYGTFEPQNGGAGFKLYFGEQPRGNFSNYDGRNGRIQVMELVER